MGKETYEAVAELALPATPERAWDALATSGGFARVYEGMSVESDWTVGSPIVWSGEWEGKKFRDQGTITVYDRPRLFEYTYWTSFWGPEPDPESMQTIRNEFLPERDGTKVRITQTNVPTAEDRDHYAANWKRLLEKVAEAFSAKQA